MGKVNNVKSGAGIVKKLSLLGHGKGVSKGRSGAKKWVRFGNEGGGGGPTTAQPAPPHPTHITNRRLKKEGKRGKRGRARLRTQLFKTKLEVMKGLEEEARAARLRQKTVIVGDMKEMSTILDQLVIPCAKPNTTLAPTPPPPAPSQARFRVKKRDKEFLDGLKYFEAAGL